ncbi:hypothetical protein DV515_00019650, partial [Chloebia gouldiae]
MGIVEEFGNERAESQICREILGIFGSQLAGKLPEAKAIPSVSVFPLEPPSPGEATTLVCLVENIFPPTIPSVSVFPLEPPSPGEATTLVCLVENIFPPALEVSWAVAGAAVARGVTLSPFIPAPDLTFVRFSRISVRPAPGDVHACRVASRRHNATAVAYWGRHRFGGLSGVLG